MMVQSIAVLLALKQHSGLMWQQSQLLEEFIGRCKWPSRPQCARRIIAITWTRATRDAYCATVVGQASLPGPSAHFLDDPDAHSAWESQPEDGERGMPHPPSDDEPPQAPPPP